MKPCHICDGDRDRRIAVDRFIAADLTVSEIDRRLKTMDWDAPHGSVKEHRNHWLKSLPTTDEDVMRRIVGPKSTRDKDLARMVRDETVARIEDGDLLPTIREGLQAQALLDRRDERKQDRELALGLARMLNPGGGRQGPPREVIDVTHTGERQPERLAGGAILGSEPTPRRQPAFIGGNSPRPPIES
jgi:hypothetical protein